MKRELAREYLTVPEMADILGVSYGFVRSNVLPRLAYVKCGAKYLVREEEFRKYLKRQERNSMASDAL